MAKQVSKDDIRKIITEILKEPAPDSLAKEEKPAVSPQITMPPPRPVPEESKEIPQIKEQYEGGDGTVQKEKKLAGFSFFKRRELTKNPATTYIATMLHGNGSCQHFVIKTSENIFMFKKKWYHLNKEKAWFDINSNQFRLMFYEDYVEPLDKNFAIQGDLAFLKVTPSSLKAVVDMEYIKVLSQSQSLTKWIKIAVYLIVANLFFTGIMVLVMLAQSGIFRGLTLS